MPYHYRITVQPLDKEGVAADTLPLSFNVTNHDNLLDVVSKTRALGVVADNEASEFAVGLKLFSEVLLRHRKSPLFEGLWPHFGDFMKRLKGGKT